MPDVRLPFARAEYAERLKKTRQAMDRAGIAVLFACDPSNMAWLTGYDGWSFYVHQGVLVGPTGDPVFWGRSMDANGALRTCYMGDDDIVGYPDDYVMSDQRHAMQHLAQLIRDRGWSGLPTRRGDGELLLFRRAPTPSCRASSTASSATPPPRQLATRGEVGRPSSATCAVPRGSWRRCTRASSR